MAHPAIPWTPHGAVLVASADRSFREKMVRQFRTAATVVEEAAGGAEALDKMEHGDWCLLLLDRSLPDLDSNELAASVKKRFGTRVVMVGSGSESSGTESVGQRLAELEDEIANRRGISAAECANPIDEVAAPKGTEEAETARMQQERGLPGMIGDSAAMQHLYRVVRLVAPRATTVLLTGATGTGKELVAQAIHILSPRAAHPLITVNCAAIPEALLESELFGHARGAFTGAVQFQAGRVHAAQGGTLFLDEIGELPLSLQAKLLRFLEQKEVQRLGTAEVLRVDVRVIAATNTNLALQVRERRFLSNCRR